MPARVLIIEDDAVVGLEFQEAVTAAGYEVLGPVRSVPAALLLARLKTPDLAVIDIGLPGGSDGIEAAHLLRREFDLPVIFVSGRSDAAVRARLDQVNPIAFLEKPCSTRMLIRAIQHAISPAPAGRQMAKTGYPGLRENTARSPDKV